jgi:small glutamine-rich tetratricopeptide repeat-containing protein alpha
LEPQALQAQPNPQDELPEAAEQGYLAHRRGDFDASIAVYTRIIKKRGLTAKQRAVSYLPRGEAQRDKGELPEAVYDFTGAINQWPNHPQAIFFGGLALAELDRLEEAFADLSRAVELDPDRESYQTNLALLKKRMESQGLASDHSAPRPAISPPGER